jgi:cytochrome c-type biogenesis protein CcmH
MGCLEEEADLKMYRIGIAHIISPSLFIFVLLTLKPLADSIDDQVREISYLLMCPVCQGQTVAESNSELAAQMRGIVRKKLKEGKSKEEILAYFVERYGETILGAPPAKGANWLLWALPALALAVGVIAVGLFLSKSKSVKGREKPEETLQELPIQTKSEYLDKLDKELKEFES